MTDENLKVRLNEALDSIKGSTPKEYNNLDVFEVVGLQKPLFSSQNKHGLCLECGLEKVLTANEFNKNRPPYWRYSIPKKDLCKKHRWVSVVSGEQKK